MKKAITAAIAAMAGAGAFAAPTITIDSVTQRWPWNNKLDIAYTVGDGQKLTDNPAEDTYYKIVFTTTINGTEYTIDGDAVGASANTGTHTVTWSGAPSGVQSDSLQMSGSMYAATAPSGDDYMVVQLTGTDAGKVTFEGLLASQALSNVRYNTDVYKSDKLVLRKIPCGTYTTGGDTGTTAQNTKTWDTYRVFYTCIFPVTQQQYSNIVGSIPSGNTTPDYEGNNHLYRPVVKISWNQIRGTGTVPSPVNAVANGTFLERLNFIASSASQTTGFDLPTALMAEIANRAGTTGRYAWGNDSYQYGLDNNLATSSENSKDTGSTTTIPSQVGHRAANGWGLFDTTGNVFEWCRDDSSVVQNADLDDPFTPSYTAGTANRKYNCGGWYDKAITDGWFFAARYGTAAASNDSYGTLGFRVAWIAD